MFESGIVQVRLLAPIEGLGCAVHHAIVYTLPLEGYVPISLTDGVPLDNIQEPIYDLKIGTLSFLVAAFAVVAGTY